MTAPNQALKAAAERLLKDQAHHDKYQPEVRLALFGRADLRTLLDALSSQASVMEAMAKALEAIRDLDTRDHHDGYDDGPGGGNFVYRDVIFTDEAFPLIDTALSQYQALGDRHDD